MQENFINDLSWKCLLGPQSHSILTQGNVVSWQVGKNTIKQHFSLLDTITSQDIEFLQTFSANELHFHYVSPENTELLKQHFKVVRRKSVSTEIDISDLSFSGKKYKSIRNALNKCAKLDLQIKDNFNDIQDVIDLRKAWSQYIYQIKQYRQDHSGKNTYFLSNQHHKEGISVFIYEKDTLIAFGIGSKPVNGYCSYIIGKALYYLHPGLSEYADYLLYQKLNVLGGKKINMGVSEYGLVFYKNKFPGAKKIVDYDGYIERKNK